MPINEDWIIYYHALELIRKSGVTNMWGAAPYLAHDCNISETLAQDILLNWIVNYSALKIKYNW